MLDTLNPQTIPAWKITLGLKINRQVALGSMTITQAENEVAIMQSDCIHEMKRKEIKEQPELLAEHKEKLNSPDSRERSTARNNQSVIFSDDEIIKWLLHKELTINENKASLWWLKHYLKCYERLKMTKEVELCKELIEGFSEEPPIMSLDEVEKRYG